MTWWQIVLLVLGGVIFWTVLYNVTQRIDKVIQRKRHKLREEKFLRFVRIKFPDATVVEAISVASSDENALANIERRIRDSSRTL